MDIGDRVAGYEVVGILGSGAMGQVYKVRNLLSERIEAMKVLLPSLEGNAELLNRFQREIRIQAAFNHPNIARLQTAQQVDRKLIMVMEYVDGTTLEKILSQGEGLTPHESVAYASQLLDALAYAHSRGAVHRDIKPANVMVTSDLQVKLMDFGIASMKAEQQLTRTGHKVGTLFYMSPEQIRGGELDARSDIYSFGITLYEMVSGRRPFQGDSDFSIMTAHCNEAPLPPIEIMPEIPITLNAVILKAIAKDPSDRFQTASDLRVALLNIGFDAKVADRTRIWQDQPPPASVPKTLGDRLSSHQTQPADLDSVFLQEAFDGMCQQAPGEDQSSSASVPATVGDKPANHRTLYMAVGALFMLAVLIIAGVEGPILFQDVRAKNPPAYITDKPSVVQVPPAVPISEGSTSGSVGTTPQVTLQSPVQQAPVPAPVPLTSVISGSVTQASGAIVARATVTVRDSQTAAAYRTLTDGQGRYKVADLDAGTYWVDIEAAGFKSVHEGVTLAAGNPTTLDTKLQSTSVQSPRTTRAPSNTQQKPLPQSAPAQAQTTAPPIPKELRDRLASLQARFSADAQELETLSNQLKLQGVNLRSSLTLARDTAKVKLAQAQSEAAAGEFADAHKSLDDVEMALGDIEPIWSK